MVNPVGLRVADPTAYLTKELISSAQVKGSANAAVSVVPQSDEFVSPKKKGSLLGKLVKLAAAVVGFVALGRLGLFNSKAAKYIKGLATEGEAISKLKEGSGAIIQNAKEELIKANNEVTESVLKHLDDLAKSNAEKADARELIENINKGAKEPINGIIGKTKEYLRKAAAWIDDNVFRNVFSEKSTLSKAKTEAA